MSRLPRRFLSPLLAALLPLAACGDKDGDSAAADTGEALGCTTEARSSVTVSLVAPDGSNPLEASGGPAVDATYTVDGGDTQSCEAMGGDLVCGWEQAGHFVILVDVEGHVPEQREVTVAADECHVISQSIEIVLVELGDDLG